MRGVFCDVALGNFAGPEADCYPRTRQQVNHTTETVDSVYDYEPHYKITREGEQVAIIAAGSFYQKGENVVRLLADKGVHATLINPRYLNAVDTATR